MSTAEAAALAMLVLGAAGCLPVMALVGCRWCAIPLSPLFGALLAAVSVTCCLGVGGASTMGWFVGLSIVCAVGAIAWSWARRSRSGADGPTGAKKTDVITGDRLIGALGALVTIALVAWCLRALHNPTIGFDARQFWLQRAGWFLQPHGQLVIDMRANGFVLPQASYPPLVGAAVSVAWSVTGNSTLRLGVVLVALLNSCALVAAALALVECGRDASNRLWRARDATVSGPGTGPSSRWLLAMPAIVGVVAAGLLVLIGFGLAEPYMTNGYADPLWSLAALGAVAYGLQMANRRPAFATAMILVVVAGMTKEEGAGTAVIVILLLVVRRVLAMRGERRGWWAPVGTGVVALLLVGAWPAALRLVDLHGVPTGGASSGSFLTRLHQTVSGLAPHLDVLVLALALLVVGGAFLRPARRLAGAGNDAWAWAGLTAGLAVVGGALVHGSANVPDWLIGSVHRITMYPALVGWWIVAVWAIAASVVPAHRQLRRPDGASPARSDVVRQRGPVDGPMDWSSAGDEAIGASVQTAE